jgi:hypothetical protein
VCTTNEAMLTLPFAVKKIEKKKQLCSLLSDESGQISEDPVSQYEFFVQPADGPAQLDRLFLGPAARRLQRRSLSLSNLYPPPHWLWIRVIPTTTDSVFWAQPRSGTRRTRTRHASDDDATQARPFPVPTEKGVRPQNSEEPRTHQSTAASKPQPIGGDRGRRRRRCR